MDTKIQLEHSRPEDAKLLTQIALNSKAHWRYPQSWLNEWKSDLTITQDFIKCHHVIKATRNNQTIGFYSLTLNHPKKHAHIEHLWLLPKFIGQGIGKQMFKQACLDCQSHNLNSLTLTADPNAQTFYEHMGMKKYDELHCEILDTPRILPKMRLVFNQHYQWHLYGKPKVST